MAETFIRSTEGKLLVDQQPLGLPLVDFQLGLEAALRRPIFQTLPEFSVEAIISSSSSSDGPREKYHDLPRGFLAEQRRSLTAHLGLPAEHYLILFALFTGKIEPSPTDPTEYKLYQDLPEDHRLAFEQVTDAIVYQIVQGEIEIDDEARVLAASVGSMLGIRTASEVVSLRAVQKQKEDEWVDRMRAATNAISRQSSFRRLHSGLLGALNAEKPHVSLRQFDVLKGVTEGLSNQEIADLLGIGFESVKSYVEALNTIFGTSSRTELAVRATRLGMV